jgi:hypothetical protein
MCGKSSAIYLMIGSATLQAVYSIGSSDAVLGLDLNNGATQLHPHIHASELFAAIHACSSIIL